MPTQLEVMTIAQTRVLWTIGSYIFVIVHFVIFPFWMFYWMLLEFNISAFKKKNCNNIAYANLLYDCVHIMYIFKRLIQKIQIICCGSCVYKRRADLYNVKVFLIIQGEGKYNYIHIIFVYCCLNFSNIKLIMEI